MLIEKIKKDFAVGIIEDIKNAQISKGKKATGESANALTYTFKNGVQIIDPLGYIIYQEYGRGAGKAPPISKLQAWCVARGIPIGVAWYIQKRIKIMGTLTFQKKAPRLGLAEILSQSRITKFAKDISLFVNIQLKSIIIKSFK